MRARQELYSRFIRLALSKSIVVSLLHVGSPVSATPIVTPERGRERASFVAESTRGMVVAAHELASKAGARMLAEGGNAVDAAVAASFAISVVRPQSTGLGGGGFLLFRAAGNAEVEVLDFRERAPAAATASMFLDQRGEPSSFRYGGRTIPEASVNGHKSVGVPGLVAGLVQAHKRYGRLPLGTVIDPALRLASDGFPVYAELALAIDERQEVLRHFEDSAKLFLPNGKALQVGALLVQKDLAWTLSEISHAGAEAFYRGSVAKRLVTEMRAGKGILTASDLANYQVKTRQPVEGVYRGYRVVSMPPPSSGGVHIIQMLNMLKDDDIGRLGWGTPAGTHLLAESMRRAFADRAAYLGDPDFTIVPVRGLTATKYAQILRQAIDPTKASRSRDVRQGLPQAYESPSTTHLSVVDKWGNAVSTTQTINYTFGSGVVARGTGIVLNDEMDDFSVKPGAPNVYGLIGSTANAVAPKKTMLSSMSPTMVFGPDHRLRLVVGSPGGPKIISATLQTILNVVDHRMNLADAVHAPRIHHQWLPDELAVEPLALTPEGEATLTGMGHEIKKSSDIGDVQAIGAEPDGTLVGVSDTRSTGRPIGL